MMKKPEQLLKTLGLDSLPPLEQERMTREIETRLEDVVMRVLAENVSKEEAHEIKTALDRGEDLELRVADAASRIPNLASKIENAVEEEIKRLRVVLMP